MKKKKSKWGRALFICFCIAVLFVVIYQVNEPRIESVDEVLFVITGCTLSFFMWYGFGVLVYNSVKNQPAGQGGAQYNSYRREPRRIVATAILDIQYKTKVKTNYPKAIAMSMLGKRAYGHVGGILGAASGSRIETIPQKVLFEVLHSDGTQRSEKVRYGSMRYKTLMRYVES